MGDTFLGTVRDYLPGYLHVRAANDLALIAQFVAPDAGPKSRERERLVRELAGHVAKRVPKGQKPVWENAARQVQRWTTQATQKRGATGFAKGKRGDVTRAKVERALRQRYTPVVVHFSGGLRFSKKWYGKGFVAPQGRDPISLRELQDILKLGRAVEEEDGARAAEEIARRVLVGFWMGDPSDDEYLKEDYGVDLPYREDVEGWGDDDDEEPPPDFAHTQFEIEQVEEPRRTQGTSSAA